MRKIQSPKFDGSTDFESAQLYRVCISRIRDNCIREQMERITDCIIKAEEEYTKKAPNSRLFEVRNVFKNEELSKIDPAITTRLSHF